MPRPHGGKLIDRRLKETDRRTAIETATSLERVEVSRTLATDTENIAKGIFSPLQGFMNQEELENVLNRKRLPNDLPWTIPILFDVSKERAEHLREGDNLAIYYRSKFLALLKLEEKSLRTQ